MARLHPRKQPLQCHRREALGPSALALDCLAPRCLVGQAPRCLADQGRRCQAMGQARHKAAVAFLAGLGPHCLPPRGRACYQAHHWASASLASARIRQAPDMALVDVRRPGRF